MSHVRITRPFKAVAPGEVYPRLFAEGEVVSGRVAELALRNGAGEATDEASTVGSTDGSAADNGGEGDDTAANDDPVRKARVSRQIEIEDNGTPVRFARGSVVEGQLAERLVDEGVAAWIDDKPAPSANKSAGSAPQKK